MKRPRKHAEVIQQLLDPVTKRQCVPGTPLRIRGAGEEGEDEPAADGEARSVIVEMDGSDRGSNTGSESGSPPHSPSAVDAQAATTEKTDATTTTTTTTTTTDTLSPLPIGEAAATAAVTASTPSTSTPTKPIDAGKSSELKKSGQSALEANGDSHSIGTKAMLIIDFSFLTN